MNIELSFPPDSYGTLTLTRLMDERYVTKKNKNNPKLADIPEILIITFIRGVEGKNVIKTKVSFDEQLELSPYIDTELYKKKNTTYILYGVNERYGQFKTQGHYVSFIKVNSTWWRFSDLYVSKWAPPFISPDVFGLFYIRKDCIPK